MKYHEKKKQKTKHRQQTNRKTEKQNSKIKKKDNNNNNNKKHTYTLSQASCSLKNILHRRYHLAIAPIPSTRKAYIPCLLGIIIKLCYKMNMKEGINGGHQRITYQKKKENL